MPQNPAVNSTRDNYPVILQKIVDDFKSNDDVSPILDEIRAGTDTLLKKYLSDTRIRMSIEMDSVMLFDGMQDTAILEWEKKQWDLVARGIMYQLHGISGWEQQYMASLYGVSLEAYNVMRSMHVVRSGMTVEEYKAWEKYYFRNLAKGSNNTLNTSVENIITSFTSANLIKKFVELNQSSNLLTAPATVSITDRPIQTQAIDYMAWIKFGSIALSLGMCLLYVVKQTYSSYKNNLIHNFYGKYKDDDAITDDEVDTEELIKRDHPIIFSA